MPAYTGWLDDKPVAAFLLFLAAGVAEIYCVATIPEARRKGIGVLMTEYPLIRSRSMGHKMGVLQSSEMGLGVYVLWIFRNIVRLLHTFGNQKRRMRAKASSIESQQKEYRLGYPKSLGQTMRVTIRKKLLKLQTAPAIEVERGETILLAQALVVSLLLGCSPG